MRNHILVPILMVFFATLSHAAAKPVVTETEGYACMGDDKSRKETEQAAINDAKRKATEYAATYIKSETHVKDAILEKDLLSAYANAKVKVLKELEKGWYKDPLLGECYKTRMKVEVIPGAGNTAPVGADPGTMEQEKTRIIHASLLGFDSVMIAVMKPPVGDAIVLFNGKNVNKFLLSEMKSEPTVVYSFQGKLEQLNLREGVNKLVVKYGKGISLESDMKLTEMQMRGSKRHEELRKRTEEISEGK